MAEKKKKYTYHEKGIGVFGIVMLSLAGVACLVFVALAIHGFVKTARKPPMVLHRGR